MKKFSAIIFCLLFTGGVSFSQDSFIIKKSTTQGGEGIEFAEVLIGDCIVEECEGGATLIASPDDKFVLCWKTNNNPCTSPPLSVSEAGNHYFRIYSKLNSGVMSEPSNEITLTIEAEPPKPPKPDGCSISRFLP